MSFLTVAFAALVLLCRHVVARGGSGGRISLYWRTPAPLKIPHAGTVTQGGVVLRMFREVVFRKPFKSTKWTWLFGWVFHMALFAVLFRHLRYFTEARSNHGRHRLSGRCSSTWRSR